MNPRTNDIIGAIPENEYDFFSKHLKLVSLSVGQVLFEPGHTHSCVYYPVGAVVSMINLQPDGRDVEMHMLGKSCMVGAEVGNAGIQSFYQAKVRSSGLAYRLDVQHLRRAWAECPVYKLTAQKAMQRLLLELSQAVVCSKKHSVDQQLIRWILLTLDNTLTASISITQQALSQLLGLRREAVSLSMLKLEENGWITKSRGAFAVLDRKNLELAACDCYWTAQQKIRACDGL